MDPLPSNEALQLTGDLWPAAGYARRSSGSPAPELGRYAIA